MRRMARRSAWVAVVASAALGISLELGCAQIFGIENARVCRENECSAGEVGEASGGAAGSLAGTNGSATGGSTGGTPSGSVGGSADAPCPPGGPGCAPAGDDPCPQYCEEISTKCSQWPQYDADPDGLRLADECLSVCQYIPPVGEGTGPQGNTLDCRREQLRAEPINRTACFAAGRGGEDLPDSALQDTCGSKCEAYCSLMENLCPILFDRFAPAIGSDVEDRNADIGACMVECGRLEDRGQYDPALTSADADDVERASIQCRLWHLGAAAIESLDRTNLNNVHCRHAVGEQRCLPAPPPP